MSLGAAQSAWHNNRLGSNRSTLLQVAIIATDDGELGMKQVRWGILGTATIAREAVLPAMLKPAYRNHLEVVAVASGDLAKAQAMDKTFSIYTALRK